MFDRVSAVVDSIVVGGVATAVVAEAGHASGPIWTRAAGRLSAASDAARVTAATVFDLASLTKVLSTAALARDLAADGRLDLDARVATLLPPWRGTERADVTVADLLEHASGLPAHRSYFEALAGRTAYLDAIASEPLVYRPRSRSIYSDLGFMLLGFILEDVGGSPLQMQFDRWRDTAIGEDAALRFLPPASWLARTAATEQDPWRGRVLVGEVHDENTAALGGVAGQAGLFGTAEAVGRTARWWLSRLASADPWTLRFARRSTVPGSSRALAWDTMLPTSSCGSRLSAAAIGHTGFTGTSIWLDPELDLYAVLLTNRVHPSRANDRLQPVRRAFHDALAEDLAV
ncbi:MAG: serine hydrolase domain-containing protein [Vicinamibacterales bacterium]